jgi:LPS-assembly lipoprotein
MRRNARRLFLTLAAGLPLALGGCGWHPLYADRTAAPANAALRAIRVDPIAERIGQRLELALRSSLNPTGIATRQRYRLRTTLAVTRHDLGIQSQGLATRGQLDVYATYVLSDLASGKTLLTNTIHTADSFDTSSNEYATVVAEDDARNRAVREINREMVMRLTLYLQRHAAAAEPG